MSTIIEKRGRCPGGGSKYNRRQIYIAISCGIIDISSNLLESLSLQHPNLQHVFSMGDIFNYYKGQTLQPHVTALYR